MATKTSPSRRSGGSGSRSRPSKKPASRSKSRSTSAKRKAPKTPVRTVLSPWARDALGIGLIVLSLLTALSLFLTLRLTFETDMLSLLPRNDPAVQTYVETLEDFGSNTYLLVAVKIPEGVDDPKVRQRLYDDFNIEIGAGLGPPKGKIWRVGLMGHGARVENVEILAKALKQLI